MNLALPTFYILNAASITKPHAIQHLSADAVITETHLKQTSYADHFDAITGYSVFQRQGADRKGGGVAVYVNSQLSGTVWMSPSDSPVVRATVGMCVCWRS